MNKSQVDIWISEELNKENVNIRDVINYYNEERFNIDPLPGIVQIFLNPLISESLYKKIIEEFKEKIPIDYYLDLINSQNEDLALKVCEKLDNYIKLSNADIKKLLSFLVDDENNTKIKEHLNKKTIVPYWIKNKKRKDFKPVPKIPSIKEALDLFMKDIENPDENIINTLKQQYALSTITDKILMVSHHIKLDLYDDSEIFHRYGPVNTREIDDYDDIDYDNDVCLKFGGCRMFTCCEFESNKFKNEYDDNYDDDNDYFIDWYTEECEVCEKKIIKRHYALRLPLEDGGWKGCYCSFECLRLNIQNKDTLNRIKTLEDQINNINIYEL